MRLPRLLFTTILVLLLSARWAAAQHGLPVGGREVTAMLRVFGVFCIGWGAGVTGWLVTGHQAMSCLFRKMPRAWKLWQKNVLTSSLPVFKYLFGGGLLLVLGTVLANQLWGLWEQAFDVGMMVGVIMGAGHSLIDLRAMGNRIDFLEANQRYLNEQRVSLFKE